MIVSKLAQISQEAFAGFVSPTKIARIYGTNPTINKNPARTERALEMVTIDLLYLRLLMSETMNIIYHIIMFVSMVKNWKNYVNIYNMTKRIRFIILVICVVLFFVVSPYIVVYSLGYRIDFEGKKITATGGINVRALPQGAEVIVDSKSGGKTSFLSPTVFVQNLLPKKHSILIRKDGYFSYQKTLEVKEKEVTRLDQVILFKEKISFEKLADKTQSPFAKQEQFFIKNNNLYQNNNDKSVLIEIAIVFQPDSTQEYCLDSSHSTTFFFLSSSKFKVS